MPENKTALILFVLGAPGTGKGTLSKLISKHFGFIHLSAGSLLRAEIKRNSATSKKIKEIIDVGNLVPSEITVGLILDNIRANVRTNSRTNLGQNKALFVIDGFPRNQENYDVWEKIGVKQTKLMSVLVFECPEDVITKRITARGRFSERTDDNKEIMKNRMVTFHEQSLPIIKHYEALGVVKKVKTDCSIDESFEKVRKIINELKTVHKF